jgi:hypothetical protein
VIFPLTITIIKSTRKFCKRETQDNLKQTLNTPEPHDLLLDFSKLEYSIENIQCYDDIQNWKRSTDKLSDAKRICVLYLNGRSSELENNITHSDAQKVNTVVKNDEVNDEMFDDVEKVLLTNISDIFSRFIFTSEYLKYVAEAHLEKNM